MKLSNRWLFFIVALTCSLLLSYGYYLQFVDNLDPCPMCIFQRICYLAIAVAAFVAFIHKPGRAGALSYSTVMGLFALLGAGIAGRQTWLQHLPPELVPECGPGLEFMLDMYPILETIKRSLIGTGDCAEVNWQFVGLSIAEWSLICFIGLSIVAAYQFVTNFRQA